MAVNEMQQKAIVHRDGPMMVIAGPGSGKTSVITRRIQNLIEKEGIDGRAILVITFTKAAALEMQARFEFLMEGEYHPVTFGTFHAIYFGIIREAYGLDVSNIITTKEKYDFLRMIISAKKDIDVNELMIPQLLSDISKVKNDGIDIEDYEVSYMDKMDFASIFKEYRDIMRLRHKIDFEDMVLMCLRLFETNPEILAFWRERFKYILIDEFQDINPMQYQVIRLLASPHNNLFIVGDDDQSIYGFRGSRPDIMLHFLDDYPLGKKVILDVNYRSTSQIVDAASKFIACNKDRFAKKLRAYNEKNQNMALIECDNKYEENGQILKLVETYKRKGSYSDTAILFRTNAGARSLTNVFVSKNIPFVFKDKPQNVFLTSVGRDILAYLACIKGRVLRSDFVRIMNKPVRYIKRDYINGEYVDISSMARDINIPLYVRERIQKLEKDINRMKKMSMYAAINYIIKGVGYEKYIVDEAAAKGKGADEEKEIMSIIMASAREYEDYESFINYVNNYESVMKVVDVKDNEDAVAFLTMHGSKGLEYKNVIIPDVNEGNIPASRINDKEQLEEERRVMYVAMTRAKENLYLLCIKEGNGGRTKKSRFIKEIDIIKND